MLQNVFSKTSLIVFLFCAIGCAEKKQKEEQLPYYNTPSFAPQFIGSKQVAAENITHTIASFSFTDQNGKKITDKDISGKIHVANFIFTSCGSICPVMTKNMKPLEKAFMNDSTVVILSYSVTPWIDNVQRLKKYTDDNLIFSANWHFLTGDKGAIYKLARQSYFAEEDLGFTKDNSEFLHTEHILLIDKTKRIRGIYNGTLQLDIEQLIKDIKILKEESSTL